MAPLQARGWNILVLVDTVYSCVLKDMLLEVGVEAAVGTPGFASRADAKQAREPKIAARAAIAESMLQLNCKWPPPKRSRQCLWGKCLAGLIYAFPH